MKKKRISLPMEFEPGLMKYQPKLPLGKGKRMPEEMYMKNLWKLILILLIILMGSLVLIYILK